MRNYCSYLAIQSGYGYHFSTIILLFRDEDPGDKVGDHSNTNGNEGEHHPDDPDHVRIGIKIIADPTAYSPENSLCSRPVELFHERYLGDATS